jgi:hypothetical protein
MLLLLCLRQVLRSAIKLLIRLRRHESVRLDRAVAGLKTSAVPCLHTRPAAAAAAAQTRPQPAAAAAAAGAAMEAGMQGRRSLQQQQQQQGQQQRQHVSAALHAAKLGWLRCWAWWLLSHLVVPLLRNSFYVTESEPYRQEVFYYRCRAQICLFLFWFLLPVQITQHLHF